MVKYSRIRREGRARDRGDERHWNQLRGGRDRGRAPGGLGRGRRLRDAAAGGGPAGGLHQALQPLHLGQAAHGPRPRLRDRRRLRPLPPRPRRRGALRLRLRRLRPAGRDGGDRAPGAPGGVGARVRRADARADEAAGLLLRLRARLLQLRPRPVPLVAVALPHPARGRPDLPRRRHRRLVRPLPHDAGRPAGRGRALLALPQRGAADPPPDLVPAHRPLPGGERPPAAGAGGALGRDSRSPPSATSSAAATESRSSWRAPAASR